MCLLVLPVHHDYFVLQLELKEEFFFFTAVFTSKEHEGVLGVGTPWMQSARNCIK